MTLLLRDRIHQLRVRAAEPRRAAEVAAALGHAELHPPSLSQAAIVFIRRLALPRTQVPDWQPAHWREAARSGVAERVREAARPILGAVPAACEAVLFADDAELLACLAHDWLTGALRERWWWRESFPASDLAQVLAAMHRAPAALPAMFALLAAEDRALVFAQRLPDAEARQLLNLLVALGSSASPPTTATVAAVSNGAEAIATVAPSLAAQLIEAALRAHRPFPAEHASGPAHRDPHDPAPVPDREHGASVASQQRAKLDQPRAFPGPAVVAQAAQLEASIAPLQASHEPAPHVGDTPTVSAPTARATLLDGAQVQPLPRTDAEEGMGARRGSGAAPSPDTDAAPPPPAIDVDATTSAAPPLPAAQPHGARPASLLDGATVQTRYGGLFYLLNLALYLDLYGDFTQPRRAGLALSPWDLLALLGAHWFGAALRADPLWSLLAQLAGRDADAEPGAGFEPAPDWQVPPQWLAAFDPPATLLAQQHGGRARLRHPAGFWIVEGDAGSPEDLFAWFPALADATLQTLPWRAPRASLDATPCQRWLRHLAGYIEARCALALGSSRRAVPQLLGAHPAQVLVTPAQLEVQLSLNALPLAIRYAGLDRDPGWLPAAGRSIRFVFG